ncbi:MAG TPA: hypothetical protein VLS93_00670 [Anaeromyxobacteraceae bacterium]|nr:hypothetical protein [Anaeromyxobacteraceae bacterium]
MRLFRLAAIALLSALPAAAPAKPWQGVNPGSSTQAEVVEKFGEPTTRTRRGNRTVLAYLGEQALPGTKQAQFYVAEDGTVLEITVFIATQLDREAIEGTYGKSPEKTFTDAFLPVWIYRPAGVTVYFGKDGFVEAITFGPGVKTAPRPAAEARPAEPRPARATAKP